MQTLTLLLPLPPSLVHRLVESTTVAGTEEAEQRRRENHCSAQGNSGRACHAHPNRPDRLSGIWALQCALAAAGKRVVVLPAGNASQVKAVRPACHRELIWRVVYVCVCVCVFVCVCVHLHQRVNQKCDHSHNSLPCPCPRNKTKKLYVTSGFAMTLYWTSPPNASGCTLPSLISWTQLWRTRSSAPLSSIPRTHSASPTGYVCVFMCV